MEGVWPFGAQCSSPDSCSFPPSRWHSAGDGNRDRHGPRRRLERRRAARRHGHAEEPRSARAVHRRDRRAGDLPRQQPAAGDLRGARGAAGIPDRAPARTVRLGRRHAVDFTLAIGVDDRNGERHGETPIVDPERAGLAVNINNEALTSLPVSTQRRYQDIWALVPGVFVRPTADITRNSRGTSEKPPSWTAWT